MKPVSRKTAANNNQEDEPSLSPMEQEHLEKELMKEDTTGGEPEEDIIMTTVAPLITQKELETSVPQKETNIKINESELKEKFKKQILKLRVQQLDCQNYEESEDLKKMIQNSIDTLNGFDTKPSSNNVDVKEDGLKNNIKKIHDIPLFQLSDDPVETRTDNKIIFDVAENFISNFETIIKTNNVDINKEWKHYRMRSFLYSKNDKHQRFYKTQINDLDEDIEWPVVRKKIIDCYGDCGI